MSYQYQYVGEGESIPGVPARDLSDREYALILDEWLAIAERIYQVKELTPEEEPAEGEED